MGSELACTPGSIFGPAVTYIYLTNASSVPQLRLIRIAGFALRGHDFVVRVDPYAPGAPPANDLCNMNSPLIVAGVPVTGNSLDAHTDLILPVCFRSTQEFVQGRDVFYRFIPACTGAYTITTCNSSFETSLEVLLDCSGAPSSILDCAPGYFNPECSTADTFPLRAAIRSVQLTAGRLYYIRLSGFGNLDHSQMGPYAIQVNADAPCLLGACCNGSLCSLTNAGNCTGSGKRFAGVNVACNLPGNNAAPCKRSDFNQSGGTPSVQDIFDYLAAWFAGDPRADFDASGAVTVQDLFDFLAAWFAG